MQAVQQVSPRSITAPDTSIANIPHYACQDAGCIRIAAECSVAAATMECRVLFLDAVGMICGTSSPVIFTSDAIPLDGVKYLATPNQDAYFPVGGPSAFAVVVDKLSAGSWTVNPLAE